MKKLNERKLTACLSLPAELLKKIDKIATKEKASRSATVAEIIERGLRKVGDGERRGN